MEPVRVLIVDDLPVVRQGLRTLLELASGSVQPALEIIGEAQNGSEAVLQSQALHPEVVLMDLEMPILDGYAATRQIKTLRPAPRVIVLSIHADSEAVECARLAGADGFVVKGAGYQVLLDAILNWDAINQPFYVRNGGKR